MKCSMFIQKDVGMQGIYEDREYVEIAIALGATRIIFTDHAPFPGNPLGNRMPYEQLTAILFIVF